MIDLGRRRRRRPRTRRFCCGQVLHREVDAAAARARARGRSRGAVAPPARTIASNSRRSSLDATFDADVAAGAGTSTPSSRHQREPAIETPLLQLEFGDAVAQQAADAIGALEHRDAVAGAIQLRRPRPGPPGPSRRPRRACRCATRGGCAVDPAFVERAIDDRRLRSP